jgi:hypothetical protein
VKPPLRKLWPLLAISAILIFASARYATLPPPPPMQWQFLQGRKLESASVYETGWLASDAAYRVPGPQGITTIPQLTEMRGYRLSDDFDQFRLRVKTEVGRGAGAELRHSRHESFFYGEGWTLQVMYDEPNLHDEAKRPRTYVFASQTWEENLMGKARRLLRSGR